MSELIHRPTVDDSISKQNTQMNPLQSALYKIAELSHSMKDMSVFYQAIHKVIAGLMYADNLFIALYDQKTVLLSFPYYVDACGTIASTRKLTNGLTEYVIKSGMPLIVDEKKLNAMIKKGELVVNGAMPLQWIGVPLKQNNKIIGVLAIQSYSKAKQFEENQIDLLTFVSHHVATALERNQSRINLKQRVKERTQELSITNNKMRKEIRERRKAQALQSALYHISELTFSAKDMHKFYGNLHEVVGKLMYAENFAIGIYNDEKRVVHLPYFADQFDSIPAPFEFSEGLCGYVHRERRPCLLTAVALKELVDAGKVSYIGKKPEYWLGVPLNLDGQIFGILIVQSYSQKYRYGQQELDLLTFVSQHIAGALGNKRSHESLQRAHQALADKTAKAQEASRAKSAFLATMSHEIRTPLNGIIGMQQLLSCTELDDRQQDYLTKINSSAQALLGLINDILDFSKIEAGKMDLESVKFDLMDIMDELSDMFSCKAADHGIELAISIDEGTPCALVGDPTRIKQILMNLTTNAIKFSERGEVIIRAQSLSNEANFTQLRISVKDSGIGISDQKLSDLFEPFTQADDSITRKFGGTGLGLSICKCIIEMMGGAIKAESKLGEGSLFYIDFTLERQAIEKARSSLPHQDLKGLKVLVVDNHQVTRTNLEQMLISFTLQPTLAFSGENALQLMASAENKSKPFDIILMDFNMPGMDGIEAALGIRRKAAWQHIPIIMMIACGQENIIKQVKTINVEALLSKPVKKSALFDTIMDLLGQQTLQPQLVAKYPDVRVNAEFNFFGVRILLVEDNSINQQIAKEFLEKVGAIISIASNGCESLKMVDSKVFDMVLMDVQMPEMDGYQATRLIRKNPQCNSMPIIAMTANAMKGDCEKCLAAGMNDYITKPINAENLFTKLAKWVKTTPIPASIKDSKTRGRQGKVTPNKVLISQLSALPGINLVSLLERVAGNLNLVERVLSEFYNSHQFIIQDLRQNIKKNDYEQCIRIAHSLSGVAGNLSAQALHKIANRLELTLVDNKYDKKIELIIIELEHHLAIAIDTSKQACQLLVENAEKTPLANNDHDQSAPDWSRLIQELNILRGMLLECDLEAEEYLRKMTKNLPGSKYNMSYTDLEGALVQFDFQLALSLLDQLISDSQKHIGSIAQFAQTHIQVS